jgi:hypothetical protein
MDEQQREYKSIVYLECMCMALICMDGSVITIICPRHSKVKVQLLEAEYKEWIPMAG